MENLLAIEKLICGYPGSFMLNSLNTSILKGSFTGIVGPNGSGKTTLFKAITGEIPVRAGNITFNGQKISQIPIKLRAQKMAIVSQHTETVDINVEDYVLLGRLPYKKSFQLFEKKTDIAIAHQFMDLTGISHYRNKLMSELSGGEQQLAAIARALTQEPELLLLDEPTAFLDISHQVQILNLIQHLNEELKLTVLLIIHDLNLASEYCNYLIMMSKGGIYKEGSPTEVLNFQDIENVYNTVVITQQNPLSKKPVVFLVSDKILKNSQGELQ
jgi:iron complex transport system ATP-binding protein